MKKIIFQNILNEFLKFFLLSLLSLSVIFWIFQAVNYMDIIIDDGRDYLVYLKFTILGFPRIVSKVMPFSLFLSMYYLIQKYEIENELVIFWNFGVHKIKFINFFLRFSIVLVVMQVLLTSLIIPKTQDVARSQLRFSSINFLDNFVKPKQFNDSVKDFTIYSEQKDVNNKLKNIYIKKNISPDEFEIIYSKNGQFININNNQYLELENGESLNISKSNIRNLNFKKFQFNLSNLESNTVTYKKTQENLSTDLIKCSLALNNLIIDDKIIKIENCKKSNLVNIYKELYKRFILPLYIPILILITLTLIFIPKEDRRYNKFKLSIFFIGILTIIFSETTLRLINISLIKNFFIIIIPIIIILTMYSLFIYFLKFRFNLKDRYENLY